MVNIGKGKFLGFSLVFTIIIFMAGVLLGAGLDKLRYNDITGYFSKNEFKTESFLTEQKFLDVFGGDKCKLAEPRINELSRELADMGKKLTDYEIRGMFKDKEYLELKKTYFVLEIKMYTVLKELNESCGDFGRVVLFFYDQDHRESKQQGYALDAVVRRFDNLKVFSIDRELSDDPLIETIKNFYDIKMSPTIIINFVDKKEGFISVGELVELLDDESD